MKKIKLIMETVAYIIHIILMKKSLKSEAPCSKKKPLIKKKEEIYLILNRVLISIVAIESKIRIK